jgi:hypothetical protein
VVVSRGFGSGGVLVGGDEDFCKISPGSSALYISFLRGFAAAIRREVVGLSDGIAGDGREGGGISLEAVSFVGFTSFAFLLGVWTDAFGTGQVVRGFVAGKGGLEAVGGPGLGGCVGFDTSFDLSLTPVTGSSIVILPWGRGDWLSIDLSGTEGLENSVGLGLWGCSMS